MTRAATARNHISIRGLFLVAGIVAFALTSFAAGPTADKDSDPRYAFERAVRMRTQLEGYLPRDRSLANYKDTIAAYHKVYLLDPQAEEVTASLIAEAELYREMARQFEPKYFQSAIDMYTFLLKQYPRTQYRSAALFAIAEIQQEDLDQTDLAVATYKDLLKRFPKSDKADAARAALKQISDAKIAEAQSKQATHLEAPPRGVKPTEVKVSEVAPDFPPLKGDVAEPRESDQQRMPYITGVRTWNSPGHTRIARAALLRPAQSAGGSQGGQVSECGTRTSKISPLRAEQTDGCSCGAGCGRRAELLDAISLQSLPPGDRRSLRRGGERSCCSAD